MALEARLEQEIVLGTQLALPTAALYELRYGAANSQHPQRNHARIAMSNCVGYERSFHIPIVRL